MKYTLKPAADYVARFADDLKALVSSDAKLGIAVSGGPDSLGLLLLAAAARPQNVEAATVDHKLRPGSADEAKMVSDVCERLGVPHYTLKAQWNEFPVSNIQARARELRYQLLGNWAEERGLGCVATGHHADDQAETVLMRLARGAGISGLVGARRCRDLTSEVLLVRPLLGWRRSELASVVRRAGLAAVDDPANRDPRHDRSRFRSLLEQADWVDSERIAASAEWLAQADDALQWALAPLVSSRIKGAGQAVAVDHAGLPRELQRRLLLTAFDRMNAKRPNGPELERAHRSLISGKVATLSGIKLEPGSPWLLTTAPPRRNRN